MFELAVLALFALLILVVHLRQDPKKARIIYLSKDKENYVRLRSNPGFTLGNLHWCRKGKNCAWRKR